MDETVRKLTQWVEYMKAGLIVKIAIYCTPAKCCQTTGQGKLTMPKVTYVQKADIMYLWLVFLRHFSFHISLRYN